MLLTPMRFKDYTWPHNPEIYQVERRRRLVAHPVPYGGCVVEDLGSECRVLRGEGVFSGESAYEQFRRLAEVFREGGAGVLAHPVWQTERAWFASLTVEEEPLPDYVRYRFEFWEDGSGYDGELRAVTGESAGAEEAPDPAPEPEEDRRVYTVRKGDTLWGIARAQGVDLTALIAANPQIKNPNRIYPGDEVQLP